MGYIALPLALLFVEARCQVSGYHVANIREHPLRSFKETLSSLGGADMPTSRVASVYRSILSV